MKKTLKNYSTQSHIRLFPEANIIQELSKDNDSVDMLQSVQLLSRSWGACNLDCLSVKALRSV
jgi:hypothetical protein